MITYRQCSPCTRAASRGAAASRTRRSGGCWSCRKWTRRLGARFRIQIPSRSGVVCQLLGGMMDRWEDGMVDLPLTSTRSAPGMSTCLRRTGFHTTFMDYLQSIAWTRTASVSFRIGYDNVRESCALRTRSGPVNSPRPTMDI